MKKEHKILIGIGLLLIAGWFYWFQIRPASIRMECSRGFGSAGGRAYETCLHRKGLK